MLLTLAVLTLVPRLTGGRHTPDLVQILLRPQLLEAQALAEALSPSSRHRGGEAVVTSARLAGCEVSWVLARPGGGGGGGVVFLVAGRDRAGMWNLLATNLTSTSLQLDRRLAAKLQQAAVFAVSGRGVEASITVEAEAAGECREAVPAPGQWTEAAESAGLPSPSTSTSTSSLAIVTLAVVSVLLTSVTAAVLLLRLRRAGHGEAGDVEARTSLPELPYSAPFPLVTPHQDTLLTTPELPRPPPLLPCPPSFPTLASEASLQPRIISTICESDEYEEVDLTQTTA